MAKKTKVNDIEVTGPIEIIEVQETPSHKVTTRLSIIQDLLNSKPNETRRNFLLSEQTKLQKELKEL